MTNTSKPKLRWFQFSLRTLLVFVTLCAVLCSWLVPQIKRFLKESQQRNERAIRIHKAMDAIQKVGGEVAVAVTVDHGSDFIVVFKSASVTDSDLKPLINLGWVSAVGLNGTQVTDAGLEIVKELKHVTYLGLTNTKVTDAGVRTLQQELPNCKIEH
jgi:hypothetical protein